MRTILIADDHPLTLLGTQSFVVELGYQVIATCTNGIAALNHIRSLLPDIALLDINMPGMSGLEVAEALAPEQLPTRLVLLTMHNDRYFAQKAQSAGVQGYILKEHATKELQECFETIFKGKIYQSPSLSYRVIGPTEGFKPEGSFEKLSMAERKVLRLIAAQYTSREIADKLFLSERTVDNHRHNIIQKLGLPKENNALLRWALQHIPPALPG